MAKKKTRQAKVYAKLKGKAKAKYAARVGAIERGRLQRQAMRDAGVDIGEGYDK